MKDRLQLRNTQDLHWVVLKEPKVICCQQKQKLMHQTEQPIFEPCDQKHLISFHLLPDCYPALPKLDEQSPTSHSNTISPVTIFPTISQSSANVSRTLPHKPVVTNPIRIPIVFLITFSMQMSRPQRCASDKMPGREVFEKICCAVASTFAIQLDQLQAHLWKRCDERTC